MLTRQVEGVHVKCGAYWAEERYGPIRLQHLSTSGGVDLPEQGMSSGGLEFSKPEGAPPKFSPSTSVIRRTFLISSVHAADVPPRLITQIQYLGWPDLSVPDEPDGILWVIAEVDKAVNESKRVASMSDDDEDPGPVLLHCSAGVGRTGGFIVVDAIIDGVRRELRAVREGRKLRSFRAPLLSQPTMEVDGYGPMSVGANGSKLVRVRGAERHCTVIPDLF